MSFLLGQLFRLILGISRQETTFNKRGFQSINISQKNNLEHIGETFLLGYHAALSCPQQDRLPQHLNQINPELRGFAYEGAAMGLTLLDHLPLPGEGRLQVFLKGAGQAHIYMVHVGVGWVMARLHIAPEKMFHQLDPLLRWLAIDGYGFHEGYFRGGQAILGQRVPAGFQGYALRAFDQGLGRSLWFFYGGNVKQIPLTIAQFPSRRRGDLWSGVGLACAYAGKIDQTAITMLRSASADYRPQLAQGAAFAAKARQRAGIPADHTELACQVLCGRSAAAAAQVTDRALAELSDGSKDIAYEIWRQTIQQLLVREVVLQ